MKYQEIACIIANIEPYSVIKKVEEYLTPVRQKKINTVLTQRLQSIQIALELPSDLRNAAAVLRSCEALGVLRVHIIGELSPEIYSKRVTQGAYQWLDIRQHANIADFLTFAQVQKITLYGAHQKGSEPLSSISVSPLPTALCLIFGNEQCGLSQQAITECVRGNETKLSSNFLH